MKGEQKKKKELLQKRSSFTISSSPCKRLLNAPLARPLTGRSRRFYAWIDTLCEFPTRKSSIYLLN
jgi:hypothetical protein